MTAALTKQESVWTSADQEAYYFASFTPPANAVLVVTMFYQGSAVTPVIADTSGLTWTRFFAGGGAEGIFAWWARTPGTPTAMVISVSFAGDAASTFGGTLFVATGVNYVNPIVQVKWGNGTAVDPILTFDYALKTVNCYFAVLARNETIGAAFVANSGWTNDNYAGLGSPLWSYAAQHRALGESTALQVKFDWATGNVAYEMLIVELAEGAGIAGSQVGMMG